MESWQSGNAPDSKSGEPVLSGRAGSNPVLSLNRFHRLLGSSPNVVKSAFEGFFIYLECKDK